MNSKAGSFARGQAFRLKSGGSGFIGQVVGSGGQGSVYEADLDGRKLALKWYHPHVAVADVNLRQRITRMVQQGAPDGSFVWPMDLAEVDGSGSFGYIMPLISPDRRPLKLMFENGKERINPSLTARVAACLNIATSFQKLHATGYCYQDINLGGFFLEPERGSIQICDADNISVDGELGGVYGTRKFMAPEVLRREALPSTKTDLYSMAVLFFYMILNWHPLDGKAEASIAMMTPAAEMALYGTQPRFVFDPKDSSNGPVTGTHDWIMARWKAMPEVLKQLFIRVFTTGLMQPQSRPLESEWRSALDQLGEAVVACPKCGFEHGADLKLLESGSHCVVCQTVMALPPLLTARRDPLLLKLRRKILEYQMAAGYVDPAAQVIASVQSNPKDPTMIGLQNMNTASWDVRGLDGKNFSVAPGKTVRILDGLNIGFGQVHGVISNVAGKAS
ncbi:protein kinase domain-containing protein [Aestuariivirga litoralis]|uniref:protein kinase domain-containing protein n=1 Tax=Aestuariivirga litoralis TaxID=2650924 RepID=UPI0018C5A369|nr:hypothetical protein [Aestuariivirga litoralis]MBG1233908.1 hypothetical protein [Aestuariivirga litoralis]